MLAIFAIEASLASLLTEVSDNLAVDSYILNPVCATDEFMPVLPVVAFKLIPYKFHPPPHSVVCLAPLSMFCTPAV